MKKLLILGGSEKMLPIIRSAKEKGYYTIVCDYIKQNLEDGLVDKFYLASTLDKHTILNIAMENSIDGIVSFSSDRIATISAYVGEKLGIPSNTLYSTEVLTQKDLFRIFLKENGFNCPKAKTFKSIEDFYLNIKEFRFPVIVKPTDSAGSTGITRVDCYEEMETAYKFAKENSTCGKVIVEEFIEMNHECMIAGDVFVINGKVEFWGILNSHRSCKENPLIPTGTSYPAFWNEYKLNEIKAQIQKVVDILKINIGPLNIELMYGKDDKLYIIEIAPRNGGNHIPELLEIATGVNLIELLVDESIGESTNIVESSKKYCATYMLHANEKGVLKGIKYSDEIKSNIIKEVLYKKIGDKVEEFNSATKAIGILFLEFNNLLEEKEKLENIDKYVSIELD